jgi:formyltetrahydrofolate hydrolase
MDTQKDNTFSVEYFKRSVKQRLQDQYLQQWHQNVNENDVCITYIIIKNKFCFEDYLIKLSQSAKRNMCNFRLSNHKLPIQRQRQAGIPREERKCLFCNKDDIGDEFHYLFDCLHPLIKENRKILLPEYFQHHPNVMKMQELFSKTSRKKLEKLSRFIGIIFTLF